MSKINVKRPGTGLIKLEVQHQGTSDIRSNFRSSLLGTSGEKQRHIVEVREFAASISQSCLTPSSQVLFRVFGRHVGVDVRAGGTFADDEFYLGDRVFAGANSQDNGAVDNIPQTPVNQWPQPDCQGIFCCKLFLDWGLLSRLTYCLLMDMIFL